MTATHLSVGTSRTFRKLVPSSRRWSIPTSLRIFGLIRKANGLPIPRTWANHLAEIDSRFVLWAASGGRLRHPTVMQVIGLQRSKSDSAESMIRLVSIQHSFPPSSLNDSPSGVINTQ